MFIIYSLYELKVINFIKYRKKDTLKQRSQSVFHGEESAPTLVLLMNRLQEKKKKLMTTVSGNHKL